MKLVNKIIIICALLIIFINNEIYAANYKTISLDIPDKFTKVTDYFYQTVDGNSTINFVYEEQNVSATETELYTEKNLKKFSESIKKETMDSVKSDVRERLEEIYGEIDDDTFKILYDNMDFEINSSKIINVGKGNYKVFKFEAVLKSFDTISYEELYTIFTKTGYYHLCIATSDSSYFKSNEYLNMISSIEISNPLSKSKATFSTAFDWEKVTEEAIGAAVLALIGMPIYSFFNKDNKEKNDKENKNRDIKHDTNKFSIWKTLGIILLSIITSETILMILFGENMENTDGITAFLIVSTFSIPIYYIYKYLFNFKKYNKIEEEANKVVYGKCKVCGKIIPYNENRTCEECYQKATGSLNDKKEMESNNLIKDIASVKKTNCKVCGKEIEYNENETCKECHQKILDRISQKYETESVSFCVNCGKKIEKSWKYCHECGNAINIIENNKIIDEDLKDMELILATGNTFFNKGDYKKAKKFWVQYINKVKELEEKDDAIWMNFNSNIDFALYCEKNKKTIENKINNMSYPIAELYFKLAYIDYELGLLDEAEVFIEESLKWNPYNKQTINELGEIYKKKRDLKKYYLNTLNLYDVIYLEEDLARYYRNLGYYFIEKQEWKLAKALYQYSIRYDNNQKAIDEITYIAQKTQDFTMLKESEIEEILKENRINKYIDKENINIIKNINQKYIDNSQQTTDNGVLLNQIVKIYETRGY